VIAQTAALRLRASSRVLQFARLSFDASTWDIFATLLAGATLYLFSSENLYPGEDLARVLRENDIDIVTLPPSALAALSRYEFKALDTLVIAGEACSLETAQHWCKRCRLINAYGPTETTVCASYAVIDTSTVGVPIGRPILNTKLLVLDDRLQAVPIGVVGELFVGGPALARGYMHQPRLTAECFIADPSGASGARMYRTGDRVRWRPDGQLEFVGRRDHQVKVRGHRIELGEVEAALTRHPDVWQAVVMKEDRNYTGNPDNFPVVTDQRLVAYIAKVAGRAPTSVALRTHLEALLPRYMIPSTYMILERLPLTSSGKVDRKALPIPESPTSGPSYMAPRNAPEVAVAAIWAQVLKVQRVGINDTFFELGGHSLLLVQALDAMKSAQIDGIHVQAITVVDMFRYPTIADLVAQFGKSGTTSRLSARNSRQRLRARLRTTQVPPSDPRSS
jgi:acyl-coenzyme A synthetase/AMP-(fatty) acid ligase